MKPLQKITVSAPWSWWWVNPSSLVQTEPNERPNPVEIQCADIECIIYAVRSAESEFSGIIEVDTTVDLHPPYEVTISNEKIIKGWLGLSESPTVIANASTEPNVVFDGRHRLWRAAQFGFELVPVRCDLLQLPEEILSEVSGMGPKTGPGFALCRTDELNERLKWWEVQPESAQQPNKVHIANVREALRWNRSWFY